jgi:hypothetical protein
MYAKDIQFTFSLPPTLARLLVIMLEGNIITPEEICDKYKIATEGRMAIHRLRSYLKGYNIQIMSKRNLGYWLDLDTQKKILELAANTGQMGFTFDHEVKADDPSSVS